MVQEDSLRSLLDDVEARRIDRRAFLQRAFALGVTPRAAAAVLGSAGVAVPAGLAAAAQTQGGTISQAIASDPETLDPHDTANSVSWTVFTAIHNALIYKDLDLTYKGALAESWDISEDNTEVTFNLREGITFHDGSEFNADAVKFSFDRLADMGAKNPNYEMALGITTEVIDPLTVKLIFDAPNAAFFNAFTGGYGAILSPSAVESAGDQYGRQPVGTNSYKFNEWATGSTVSLTAFEDFAAAPGYYENTGSPHIDEYVYRVIPEPFAQIASLETGEIDAVGLTATDLPRFEDDERFEIFSANSTALNYLGMNVTRPILKDVTVRTAIVHAVDRNELVDTLFEGGLAQATATPLPPSIPGYDEALEATAPAYDPDAAATLLDEAGWIMGDDGVREKDGEKLLLELYTASTQDRGQQATLIQSQLRKVGIDVEINQLEVAALLDFSPSGEHDLFLLGWSWSDPDALFLFLSSDRVGTSNHMHYSNPELDALLIEGQQAMDQDVRMDVYRKAQEVILADSPWVALWMPISKTAVNTRVQNVSIYPTGGLLTHDAWIED